MQPRPSLMSITSRTIAIVLAMALVAVISLAGSRAVFSATTDNTANSLATANIDLTDNDTGVSMFAVVGMLPGDSVDHCIDVTYTGPASRDSNGVRVYVPSFTDSATLGDDLLVTIEEGTGAGWDPAGTRLGDLDGLGDCSGFTSTRILENQVALSALPLTWATASSPSWTPIVTDTNTVQGYRITVTLASSSTQENESATVIPFTWEVQAGS